jgi:predicted O-methyltransferase YrrM
MKVFEFGSGNSTLWWSDRVDHLVSCEHDRQWYDNLRDKLPQNTRYIHAALDSYADEISNYENTFDIVVIDGRRRTECAKRCVPALRDSGVIVWDNSDREKYRTGYDYLLDNGFKRLDFGGMGPINTYEWSTSVFYRDDNCLNI